MGAYEVHFVYFDLHDPDFDRGLALPAQIDSLLIFVKMLETGAQSGADVPPLRFWPDCVGRGGGVRSPGE